jgi:hypothetical protein
MTEQVPYKTQKEELINLIEFLKKATGKNQSEIGINAGYAGNSLTEILAKPKGHGTAIKKLRIAYKDILNNSTSANTEVESNTEFAPMQAILKLIDANRDSIETNRLHAEARVIEAKNNDRLINMVERKFTVGVEAKSQVDGPSIIDKVLEVVAVVGSGKKWTTKEAAEKALRTLVFGDQPEFSKSGTYHE